MVEFDLEVDEEVSGLIHTSETSAEMLIGQRIKLKFRAQDWEFVRNHIDNLIEDLKLQKKVNEE